MTIKCDYAAVKGNPEICNIVGLEIASNNGCKVKHFVNFGQGLMLFNASEYSNSFLRRPILKDDYTITKAEVNKL